MLADTLLLHRRVRHQPPNNYTFDAPQKFPLTALNKETCQRDSERNERLGRRLAPLFTNSLHRLGRYIPLTSLNLYCTSDCPAWASPGQPFVPTGHRMKPSGWGSSETVDHRAVRCP